MNITYFNTFFRIQLQSSTQLVHSLVYYLYYKA